MNWEQRYEQMSSAHHDFRHAVWAALLQANQVAPFSYVSEYTNPELIRHLRIALGLGDPNA
jgi:hypothetical protein